MSEKFLSTFDILECKYLTAMTAEYEFFACSKYAENKKIYRCLPSLGWLILTYQLKMQID